MQISLWLEDLDLEGNTENELLYVVHVGIYVRDEKGNPVLVQKGSTPIQLEEVVSGFEDKPIKLKKMTNYGKHIRTSTEEE